MLHNAKSDQNIIDMLERAENPQDLVSIDVLKSCLDIANNHLQEGSIGEKYLQCVARKTHGEAAAKAAGMLADVYFLQDSYGYDGQSNFYNKLAATAYQQSGHVELASHYFNQYLARAPKFAVCTSEELMETVSFLLANNTLVCTDRVLGLLQLHVDGASDTKLAEKLSRLISRAENRTIYLELSRSDAKRQLNSSAEEIKKQLMEMQSTTEAMPVLTGRTSAALFSGSKTEETGRVVEVVQTKPAL